VSQIIVWWQVKTIKWVEAVAPSLFRGGFKTFNRVQDHGGVRLLTVAVKPAQQRLGSCEIKVTGKRRAAT
jgi:creatinine amidohydrolase/Fe(II)-dependent formamide hydrolase-like protein